MGTSLSLSSQCFSCRLYTWSMNPPCPRDPTPPILVSEIPSTGSSADIDEAIKVVHLASLFPVLESGCEPVSR